MRTTRRDFLKDTGKGLAGLAGAFFLPSCAPNRVSSQIEPKLIYGVSIESDEKLRDVSIFDSQGSLVYNLMKNGRPLTELRMETEMTGGRIGNTVYDDFTTKYSLRFPSPLESKGQLSKLLKPLFSPSKIIMFVSL